MDIGSRPYMPEEADGYWVYREVSFDRFHPDKSSPDPLKDYNFSND